MAIAEQPHCQRVGEEAQRDEDERGVPNPTGVGDGGGRIWGDGLAAGSLYPVIPGLGRFVTSGGGAGESGQHSFGTEEKDCYDWKRFQESEDSDRLVVLMEEKDPCRDDGETGEEDEDHMAGLRARHLGDEGDVEHFGVRWLLVYCGLLVEWVWSGFCRRAGRVQWAVERGVGLSLRGSRCGEGACFMRLSFWMMLLSWGVKGSKHPFWSHRSVFLSVVELDIFLIVELFQ